MERLEVRASLELWNDAVALLFRIRGQLGAPNQYGSNIIMSQIDDPAVSIPPTCVLEMTAAQSLMDQLWQCGLRPTEGSGSAGALRAVESHRDDLRKLLFHKEGIQS